MGPWSSYGTVYRLVAGPEFRMSNPESSPSLNDDDGFSIRGAGGLLRAILPRPAENWMSSACRADEGLLWRFSSPRGQDRVKAFYHTGYGAKAMMSDANRLGKTTEA